MTGPERSTTCYYAVNQQELKQVSSGRWKHRTPKAKQDCDDTDSNIALEPSRDYRTTSAKIQEK